MKAKLRIAEKILIKEPLALTNWLDLDTVAGFGAN